MKRLARDRGLRTVGVLLCLALLGAVIGLPAAQVQACGPTTHNEAVERGYDALDKETYATLAGLLQSYAGVADAGSAFPDWGYGMAALGHGEIYRTYSYAAHDYTEPSLRAQYLQYLIDLLEPPYSDDDLKTLTFLFGLIGHQEADYTWHDNFVPVASLEDGATENLIEIGADLFVNIEYGEQGDDIAWFYPVQFLLDTYQAVGYEVPPDKFVQGLVILSVGVELDKQLSSPLLALLFRLRLPWTHENFVTYPNGGLMDGGNLMAAAWQMTWDEFAGNPLSATPIRGQGAGSTLMGAPRRLPAHTTLDSGRTTAPYMELAHTLLDEGVVRVDWQLNRRTGNLTVGPVEVVDPERLEQIGLEFLTRRLGSDRRDP